jgi:hypothetical protein
MPQRITIGEILELAGELSEIEREQLIDELGKTFHGNPPAVATGARGVGGPFRGQPMSREAILETRREMWFGFPRDGI